MSANNGNPTFGSGLPSDGRRVDLGAFIEEHTRIKPYNLIGLRGNNYEVIPVKNEATSDRRIITSTYELLNSGYSLN